MEYKYILFDLDGTLTESGPGIINSVSYALEKLGIPVGNRENLKKFIGPPLTDSLECFYGVTGETAERGIAFYREYYTKKGIFENSLYDGVSEMLCRLKAEGYILAMATSKPEVYARKIAEHYQIAEYFTAVCGADLEGLRVDKADVIRYALDTLEVTGRDKAYVLMVGDRKHDIQGAKRNEIASLGVLYGYGDRKELEEAGADYFAASPAETAEEVIKISRHI